MPSRRSHSKSRNGCVQCKRARIKCDQSSPSCSKCRKSNKKCLYSLAPQIPSPTPISSPPFTTLAPTTGPSTLISTFEPADLELMHHYSTSTYLSLAGQDPQMQQAWQVQVPLEAYSHPYLMHSLLALAALHRNSLTRVSERRYSHESALRHYNHALATSKPALSNVSADNCTSLFVFSAVIAITAVALPLHSSRPQPDDPVAELLQISTLVRGSKSIVQVEFDRVKAGSVAALFPHGFLAHDCDIPSDTRTALALLQRHVDTSRNTDDDAKAAYKHTVELLELCFRNTVPDPENRMVVLSWLAMVPDTYLSLLHARAPIAQVCLAYFAVMLHGLRNVWWCGDWGKRLVMWMEREVAEECYGLLDWPKKEIG